MKKQNIIIGIMILVVIAVIGILIGINKKEEKNTYNTNDMIKMVNTIYKDLEEELPSLETVAIDVRNMDEVTSYTGLQSNENIESLVVSLPMMNAQAYSVAVVKVKETADVEKLKQEMLDNIDMRRWICVSAEKLYITNSGNIIFLVMSSEDIAKPVYEGFKKYVNNQIGKELEKSNEEVVELPPEMTVE